MKLFKPLLAPNTCLTPVDGNKLESDDYMVQFKIDGIRGFTEDGQLLSRSRKPLPNKHLAEYFSELLRVSKELGVHIDGELDADSVSFNELSGILRSHDKPLPEDLKFIVFDMFDPANEDCGAMTRLTNVERLITGVDNIEVIQNITFSGDFIDMFEYALEAGYEGLMVKHKHGYYKQGRATFKQGLIFKMKPYETFDTEVLGVQQATEVDPNAEKKVNELGRSETSRKKGDRIPIQSASAILTNLYGVDVKVSLSSLTHEERKDVWQDYLKGRLDGRLFEWKGMLVGSKDAPRHPVFIRWRDDK